MTFTDATQFTSTLTGAGQTITTVDFESAPANTTIPNGSDFDNINFSFLDGGGNSFDGMVSNEFSTTSGSNSLGYNDPTSSSFLSGDAISMSFSQTIHALGFYLIVSPGDFGFTDDALLSAGNAIASNGSTANSTLADGGEAFFIGLIDTDGFTLADLNTLCCGFFEFNIDDIQYATITGQFPIGQVGEPGTLMVLMLSLGLLVRLRQS